jgi:hypothetical protein
MKPDTNKPKGYESNPFKLALAATQRLFNTNRTWAIILFILGLVGAFSGSPTSQEQSSTTQSTLATDASVGKILALVVLIVSLVAIVVIVALVIGTYVQGILSYVALQSEKGNTVRFSEARDAVRQRFWRLLGAQLLAIVKICGWLLLFIIPGIIAAFRYSLLSYVIMDESADKHSVKESHDRVKTLTNSRLWEVAGVSMTGIVPALGGLLDIAGKAAQYNQLKHYHDSKIEKPRIHWLNYMLPVALLLAIIALGAILTALAIRSS